MLKKLPGSILILVSHKSWEKLDAKVARPRIESKVETARPISKSEGKEPLAAKNPGRKPVFSFESSILFYLGLLLTYCFSFWLNIFILIVNLCLRYLNAIYISALNLSDF